ncbi:LytTR family DNA-binding domain-containing protein [Azospirillum brasilense]|uniref:LytTR family DNA-binding domain-containing protein n=1 Tax=Azospirillum brasilense TaxID=192 RepID=UPI001FFE9689|nr:LytTR family DNA-binding domain-containing protein [Azospirillum brasilense]
MRPLGLAELFVYVVLVTLLVSAIPVWLELRDRGLLAGPTPPPSPPAPDDAPAFPPAERAEPAFLARLPARLGRDLLALEMEDHYVRAHTAEGSDLILMRLRDAIAELAGLDGMQVHRSHWVAAAAVAGVERKPDGKLVLVLRDGRRVPVSRSHAAAVREAGWVDKAGP